MDDTDDIVLRKLDLAALSEVGDVDPGVLEDLYADDLVLHAPNARIMDRNAVLAAAGGTTFWYDRYERTTESVTIVGGIGITMGGERVVPGVGPDAGQLVTRRFTHVYQRELTGWKLLARHASRGTPSDSPQ